MGADFAFGQADGLHKVFDGGKLERVKAVVVDGDPSYCTAIKTDKNFVMESGLLEITHTGMGGKGISCDDAIFNGGSANISVSGHGEAYTDIEGKTDTYSSTCISADGNFTLAGANLTLTAAGNASKGVKCDTDVNITAGSLTGILSGNAVITEGDPSYCAGIKADGNITVDGGSINIDPDHKRMHPGYSWLHNSSQHLDHFHRG